MKYTCAVCKVSTICSLVNPKKCKVEGEGGEDDDDDDDDDLAGVAFVAFSCDVLRAQSFVIGSYLDLKQPANTKSVVSVRGLFWLASVASYPLLCFSLMFVGILSTDW